MAEQKNAIAPTREEDYAEWYQQVVKAADLAEHSPVRGCMIIKPHGYALWENIRFVLNKMIKDTGHKNAYFPLFVPLSFLEKEAKHVEGFAKECAIVTHHRLEKKGDKLVPAEDSKLEEPLIIRPTSEMIIGEVFSKWVESYRDLPLLINQWANVVRWEMRTRLFLRTTEFLWQEGHTVHATESEAQDEVFKMLNVYKTLLNDYLALPVILGKKSEKEKFPGAVDTYSLECMMQDKKALQGGTSHFLGQNFSKSSNIKYSDVDGTLKYAFTTSWGVSTRLIGALLMSHSDDNGAVFPPKIAPIHIVILPVIHNEETFKEDILRECEKLKQRLNKIFYHYQFLNVEVDNRDIRGGEKKWNWIKKGVPLILEIGPKDLKNESVFVLRRDNFEKKSVKIEAFVNEIINMLDKMQNDIFLKAKKMIDENIFDIKSKDEFYDFFHKKAGFAKVFFCLNDSEEETIHKDLSVSLRSIPLKQENKIGKCFFCSKETNVQAIFAKAY
ncbi:MAG: proline--tRNA ligase [Chlamydiae bacterium RIFCSPHIGHO2_12_FULL_27_8]|nr:MAG: proline--tRNA ligase [Chlamydiae bacterium RIFCSPHIGHO2_12_FULL_27_8]